MSVVDRTQKVVYELFHASTGPRIDRYRLTYYARATYAEVTGDDDEPRGAAFVDQWYIEVWEPGTERRAGHWRGTGRMEGSYGYERWFVNMTFVTDDYATARRWAFEAAEKALARAKTAVASAENAIERVSALPETADEAFR